MQHGVHTVFEQCTYAHKIGYGAEEMFTQREFLVVGHVTHREF